MSTIKQIKQMERKRAELLESILGITEMIGGSFSTVYRKCGKPNCWCVNGRGHPVDRIVFVKRSRSKTTVVPKEDVLWVRSAAENRREFRRRRRELRAVEKAVYEKIKELEAEIINRSTEGRAWLEQGFGLRNPDKVELREKKGD